MRPAAVFTGLAGMAVVASLLMAAEARLRGGTGGEDTTAAEAPEMGPAAEITPETGGRLAPISDADAEIIARAAQPAAPSPASAERMTATPADPPPPPDTPGGQAAGPAAKKPIELTRPVAENAGVLSFGERRLQLAGIVPTPTDRICGPAGRQWPCGMLAKTALRQLLRNRSLTCDLGMAEWKGTATAACRLGTQDLGTWLAENGWAEAEAGSPLGVVAEKAKQAQKGIYGGDPRRK
ncbi:thermonuclease family protein [Rhizobium mulingense]|uniref:thermonuclease family protein n=1 Tax=Rhizobium mulingense TaxID=3031128 RepID=UPI002B4851DD|nr:thermonuclease family protein [Rhizobium sp. MJ21]MEB3042910.1 thermonuclease family protein [Rhizobium sp. MJ21]